MRISETIVVLPVALAILQVELRVELQEAILVREHLAARDERLVGVDQALQPREVVLPGVDRRKLRDARLDQAARLEDAGDLAEAQLGLGSQQLERDVARGDRGAAARAGAHLQDAGVCEHAHGLAHGRAADLHRRGELAFGREPVALAELAEPDPVRDLLDGALERASRTHWDEPALHVGEPYLLPTRGLPSTRSWYTN